MTMMRTPCDTVAKFRSTSNILIALLAGALMLLFAGATVLASEAYILVPGDSVRVRVFGRSELSGDFLVRETGDVAYPLIGTVDAAGLTASELEASIAARLAGELAEPLQVGVEVSDYQPIYMDGDVVRPGAYTYRPGLTVAKAIALSGGRYSLLASGSSASLGVSELQESFGLLLDAYWADVARESRLLSEREELEAIIVPPDLRGQDNVRIGEILDNEDRLFETRRRAFNERTVALEKRRTRYKAEIELLKGQLSSIERKRRIIGKQLEDLRGLVQRGVLPKVQALQLEISATSLEQESRAAAVAGIRARRGMEATEAELVNLRRDRSSEIAATLQTVQDSLTRTRTRLDQVNARLATTRYLASREEALQGVTVPVRFYLTRGDGKSVAVDASAELLPGDVVEVPFPELPPPPGGALPLQLPGRGARTSSDGG